MRCAATVTPVTAVFATSILDIYKRRWSIETWFRTLKTGTRIKSRRFDAAEDLRKCLAFDAVTACRVADLTQLARERPDTPAATVVPQEDIELLHTMLRAQGHKIVPTPSGEPDDEPSGGEKPPPESAASDARDQADAADPAPQGEAVAEPPDVPHQRASTEPDDAAGPPDAKDETGTSDADDQPPATSGADPPEAADRPTPDNRACGPPAAALEPDIQSFVIDLGRLRSTPFETAEAAGNQKGLAGSRKTQLGRAGTRRPRREKVGMRSTIRVRDIERPGGGRWGRAPAPGRDALQARGCARRAAQRLSPTPGVSGGGGGVRRSRIAMTLAVFVRYSS